MGPTLLFACLALAPSEPARGKSAGYDEVVAVVVGITEYGAGRERLPNAAIDAKRFADLMRERGLVEERTLFPRYDGQATRRGIYEALQKGLRAAKGKKGAERTLLIFYFAGHGEDGVLIPARAESSADHVRMSELKDLAKADNGVRHQLFILSSCFSGSVFRSDSPKNEDYLLRYEPASRWVDRSLARVARVAITAGRDTEKIPDGAKGEGSVFGQAVLRALRKPPGAPFTDADLNQDGCISSFELAAFVSGHGAVEGMNQPYFGSLPGDDQGVIAFCDAVLPAPRPGPVDPSPRRGAPEGMVFVPGGPFLMGCNAAVDTECDEDEKPSRQVDVRPFYLDRTEVTVADYRACVKAGGCSAEGIDTAFWGGEIKKDWTPFCNWTREGRDRHPINCVSWDHADAYCRWKKKRLPTEAEWEKGARGASGRKFPWGNDGFGGQRVANVADESAKKRFADWSIAEGYDDGFVDTSPAGSFPLGASPYGALDMSGNVWEWVEDWYDKGKYRSVRGGSWGDRPWSARASDRAGGAPGDRSPRRFSLCPVARILIPELCPSEVLVVS